MCIRSQPTRVWDRERDAHSLRQLSRRVLGDEQPEPDDLPRASDRLRRPTALGTGDEVRRRGLAEAEPTVRTANMGHNRPLSALLSKNVDPESEKSWAHRANRP